MSVLQLNPSVWRKAMCIVYSVFLCLVNKYGAFRSRKDQPLYFLFMYLKGVKANQEKRTQLELGSAWV